MKSTQTLMQLVEFGRQGDSQLLVEGESCKPVLKLLERWAEKKEKKGTVNEGTGRGFGG